MKAAVNIRSEKGWQTQQDTCNSTSTTTTSSFRDNNDHDNQNNDMAVQPNVPAAAPAAAQTTLAFKVEQSKIPEF